ncbi:MAG: transglutaminase domain-containing protein [Elusimicrobia bacterium]|nr:transglutaminase domain-containing protein [Elusimicrobiota bacterium]
MRVTLRVMPPIDREALNDDFQEAVVLKETAKFWEIKATLHPDRSIPIQANPNWRRDDAGMTEYLKPGPSTNWDEKLRQDILAELKEAGIDPEAMDDKELVEKVAHWAHRRAKYLDKMSGSHDVYFPNGEPQILPGLEPHFERGKGSSDWSDAQQFEHVVLGKSMFYHRTTGSCTSYATYQATILRALGIPTRIIIAIPILDASDPTQLKLLSGIRDSNVRQAVVQAASEAGESFNSHTFNEVYVGKRWVRLNYNRLGQPILDPKLLGLMVHVKTFNDLAEANLAQSWGLRFGLGRKDDVFRWNNPYTALKISDSGFSTQAARALKNAGSGNASSRPAVTAGESIIPKGMDLRLRYDADLNGLKNRAGFNHHGRRIPDVVIFSLTNADGASADFWLYGPKTPAGGRQEDTLLFTAKNERETVFYPLEQVVKNRPQDLMELFKSAELPDKLYKRISDRLSPFLPSAAGRTALPDPSLVPDWIDRATLVAGRIDLTTSDDGREDFIWPGRVEAGDARGNRAIFAVQKDGSAMLAFAWKGEPQSRHHYYVLPEILATYPDELAELVKAVKLRDTLNAHDQGVVRRFLSRFAPAPGNP